MARRFVQVIKQLFRSNTPEPFVKLVGRDRFENKFYERLPGRMKCLSLVNIQSCFLQENRHYNSSRRFYQPADYENVRLTIDPAWEGEYE